jgi:hypothetical protein
VKNLYLPILFFLFCFTADAQTITTIAGMGGVLGNSGDGGPATAAKLYNPAGIAFDAVGNLYVADFNNTRIRKIDPAGIISTIAGGYYPGHTGDGGPATDAQLEAPEGLAVDAAGNVYFTDGRSCIRRVDASTGIITTIAGNWPYMGYYGNGVPATDAFLNYPKAIVVDGSGNIYFSDYNNHKVRKIDPAGIITDYAGNGVAGYGGDGGSALTASIRAVNLGLDGSGKLYLADEYNYRVRKIDASGIIRTIAGSGAGGYSGDGGPAMSASLYSQAVTMDNSGDLLIADYSRIRMVNTFGIINTIAGSVSSGFSGDGGPATAATMYNPWGLATRDCSKLYISDQRNHCIRVVDYNDPPTFIGGHLQYLRCCLNDIADSINAKMAVSDDNVADVDMWSILTAPMHGTITAGHGLILSGLVRTPTGYYYTPTPGYVGADTFKVIAYDCGNIVDTTMICVSVDPPPVVGAITGVDSVCLGNYITLTDTSMGGMWFASNPFASVSAGLVLGATVGIDTISYIIYSTCGSDTAYHTVVVKSCPVLPLGVQAEQISEMLTVVPNPSGGEVSCTLSATLDEEVHLSVTDVTGRKIFETTSQTNKPTMLRIDGPAGVYFLNATTAAGAWSAKVVVAK